MTERITVVGTGVVGTNLSSAFVTAGHQVRIAARDPDAEHVTETSRRLGVAAVGLDEASAATDIIVVAVPHAAVVDAVQTIDPGSDAIVVDATNPVGAALPADASSTLDMIASTGVRSSLVKAFNTIGAEAFLDPTIDGRAAFLPVAGDPPGAERVAAVGRSIGFDALVIGGRDRARLNESFAELWIHLAFGVGLGRDFGFAMVRR